MDRAAPPPGEAASRDQRQEILYYLGLLWRRRGVLAAGALIGLALGLGFALVRTPIYQASAMLRIDMPTPPFVSVSEAFSGTPSYWQYQDFYNTEFKVLASQVLGEKAVRQLKLEASPPFKGAREPGRVFMAHVQVEPLPQTRLVNLRVTHTDPKDAALWANTLADVYVEQSVSMRVDAARQAYQWLQERLVSTQQNMLASQEKLLQSYRAQDVIMPEAGGVSALAATITRITGDLAEAQARRIEIESVIKAAAALRGQGRAIHSLPQVTADPVVVQMNTQLAERAAEMRRLREKYTNLHPEVQRVQGQMDDLAAARAARADQVLLGLEAELTQVRAREQELRDGLAAQKAQAAAQTRTASRTEALRKEADSSENLYEVLLQKLNETDIASSLKANNVTVVERAAEPLGPISPDRRRFASIGLALGLLAGLGLVIGLDLWHDTVKSAEELEHHLHLDVLAVIPRHADPEDGTVREAYQNLRTALLFSRTEEHGQVVLVTGTVPQEGKTTTALHLAQALAAAGERTLLVDCDLRRGQLHARLSLSREPGLTDVLALQHGIDEVLRPGGRENLAAITSGPVPPNPPALLARKQLGTLFEELARRFEWVIVDSPPLASVTDAQLLGRYADACVYVVQHDKVNKALVRRSLQALRRSGANVLGGVLNAVALERGGYYYNYRYDDLRAGDGKAERAASSRRKAPAATAARAIASSAPSGDDSDPR